MIGVEYIKNFKNNKSLFVLLHKALTKNYSSILLKVKFFRQHNTVSTMIHYSEKLCVKKSVDKRAKKWNL